MLTMVFDSGAQYPLTLGSLENLAKSYRHAADRRLERWLIRFPARAMTVVANPGVDLGTLTAWGVRQPGPPSQGEGGPAARNTQPGRPTI